MKAVCCDICGKFEKFPEPENKYDYCPKEWQAYRYDMNKEEMQLACAECWKDFLKLVESRKELVDGR